MDTIAKRIMKIIETKGCSKSDFARAINVTPAYISKLGKFPDSVPSERTIISICREFNVNPEWLQTGNGPMFRDRTRYDELSEFIGDLLKSDMDLRHRFILAISKLSIEQLEVVRQVAVELVKQTEEEKTDPQE